MFIKPYFTCAGGRALHAPTAPGAEIRGSGVVQSSEKSLSRKPVHETCSTARLFQLPLNQYKPTLTLLTALLPRNLSLEQPNKH